MTEGDHQDDWLETVLGQRIDAAVKAQLKNVDLNRSFIERTGLSARALVLDANRLRGELKRLARAGEETALVTLARSGFVRLFAAEHVFVEVDRYAQMWAVETDVDPSAYLDAWTGLLRPLVTKVGFAQDVLTPDELARIDVLSQPPPHGDPDDVPTAVAAMVLQAPVLTGDARVLRAVYGPDIDPAQHDAYVQALFGGGRVLSLTHWGHAGLFGAQLAVGTAASAGRAVTAKVGILPPLLMLAASAALTADSDRVRARITGLFGALQTAALALVELCVYYQVAASDYAKLMSPLPGDFDALQPEARIAREAARRAAFV